MQRSRMGRLSALEQTLAVIMVLFSWSLALRLLPMVEPLPSRRLVKYALQSKPSLSLDGAAATPLAAADAAQEAYDADEERLHEAKNARGSFSWRRKERRRNKRSWLPADDYRRVIDKSWRPLHSASPFQVDDNQIDASESCSSASSKRASVGNSEIEIDLKTQMHQHNRESVPRNMYKNHYDNHLVDAILDLKQGLLLERRNEESAKSRNWASNRADDIPQKIDNSEYIGLLRHSLANDRTFGRAFTTEFRPRRTIFWHRTAPSNDGTLATGQSSAMETEKARERKSAEDTNRNLKLVTKVGNAYLKAPRRNFQFQSIDGKGGIAPKPEVSISSGLEMNRSIPLNMTQTPLRQYKPTGAQPCYQVPCSSSPCRKKSSDLCCSGKCSGRRCGKVPCDTQTTCNSNCGRKILQTQHHAPSTQTTMSGSQAVGNNDAAEKLSVIVWDPVTQPNKFSPTLMLLPKSIINLPKLSQGNEAYEDTSARRSANRFFRIKPSEDWVEEVNPRPTLDEYLTDKAVQAVQSNAVENDSTMDQSNLNKIFNLNLPNKGTEVRVAVPEIPGGLMSSEDILPKKDCTLQRIQYMKPSMWSRLGVPRSHSSNQNYMKPGEADKQRTADSKAAMLSDLYLRPLSFTISTSTEKFSPAPLNMTPIKWQPPIYSPTTAKHTPYQVSVYVWKENELPQELAPKPALIDQNAIDLLLNQTMQARNLQDIMNSRKQAETAPNKSIPDALPHWMMQLPHEGSTTSVR